AVGAHTLLTAGVAIDLGDVDQTVRRALADTTVEAERRVTELLAAGSSSISKQLDPAHRESLMGKALDDFRSWRDSTLAGLDPQLEGSSAARLVDGLSDQLQAFDERLTHALDPTADGSGFSALSTQMEVLFRELFAQLGRDRGRQEEALVGTAKGVDFEDAIEERLRTIARSMGGCIVERTSRQGGQLGSEALVGDFVFILPSGRRVVVEAKNQTRLGLHGANGILAELERAMANRTGDVALCVSAVDAFPAEVGPLGRFGDAVLVVDDGAGPLLEAALRWAAALANHSSDSDGVDAAAVGAAISKIRSKARQLSDAKRALTEIGKSVSQVQDSLDGMRRELIDIVDEVSLGLRQTGDGSLAA
ncbi:MAG: hypothetical protein V3R84_02255, partial [Acidimicrobiia bacterium]